MNERQLEEVAESSGSCGEYIYEDETFDEEKEDKLVNEVFGEGNEDILIPMNDNALCSMQNNSHILQTHPMNENVTNSSDTEGSSSLQSGIMEQNQDDENIAGKNTVIKSSEMNANITETESSYRG